MWQTIFWAVIFNGVIPYYLASLIFKKTGKRPFVTLLVTSALVWGGVFMLTNSDYGLRSLAVIWITIVSFITYFLLKAFHSPLESSASSSHPTTSIQWPVLWYKLRVFLLSIIFVGLFIALYITYVMDKAGFPNPFEVRDFMHLIYAILFWAVWFALCSYLGFLCRILDKSKILTSLIGFFFSISFLQLFALITRSFWSYVLLAIAMYFSPYFAVRHGAEIISGYIFREKPNQPTGDLYFKEEAKMMSKNHNILLILNTALLISSVFLQIIRHILTN